MPGDIPQTGAAATARLINGLQRVDTERSKLDAIESFVTSADARNLLELARRVRVSARWHASGWNSLTPADLSGFEQQWPGTSTGAVIASMSRNGYLREAAVRSLAATCEGPALGALIIRAADWVDPVQELAAAAVSAELDANPQQFVRWLPMLDVSSALSESATGRLIESTSRSPQLTSALSAGLLSTDIRVRQACGRRISVLHLSAETRREALERALVQSDPATAAFVVLPVLDNAEVTDDELRLAAASRHSSARARAVWTSRERAACDDLAVSALTDTSAAVRNAAQQVIRGRGLDPAEVYRSRLLAGYVDTGSISGLGETGGPEDASVLQQFIAHPRVRVRLAALGGIGRLDPSGHVDVLVAALRDGSQRVARAAAAAIRPAIGSVDRDRLWEAMRSAPPGSSRWAMWLLSQPGGYVELATCLRVVAEGPHHLDDRATERIAAIVDGWAALSRRQPSDRHRVEIIELLPRARPSLGTPLRSRLDAAVASWASGVDPGSAAAV